jgi:eukaryotic-like serine/threonine-protein kinase
VTGRDPSTFKGLSNPVETVSWFDAVAFCKLASAMTGRQFRLPTEAEWEFSCRAGSKTRYFFGDNEKDLDDYAWFSANSKSTHPVGQKKPNAWGLYDMVASIGQWCLDQYSPSLRRFRGGCWALGPAQLRAMSRTESLSSNLSLRISLI